MNTVAKTLVPNKSWLVENDGTKIGTLNKEKKGFSFYRKGFKIEIKDLTEVKQKIGLSDLEQATKKSRSYKDNITNTVYDYPCATLAYNPVYNIVKRLPIYAKSNKSKSLYCAGYYVIKFRKGWVKSFCPKLITLERYPFKGPFKTETEMRTVLNTVSKNETT